MKTKEIIEKNKKYVMNTYGRIDVAFERGEGTKLYDVEGKEYLDFLAGIAVVNLGHSNPKITEVIKKQAEKLIHTSNYYYINSQAELAKILVENTCCDKVFFCNSGAEANEGAIKLARKYGKKKLGGKNEIITMKKSFHGRTITTITATGQEKYQKDFTPLTEGFKYAEFGNIEDLKNKINDNTLAVMIEIIQGEGGVNIAPDEYWEELKRVLKEKNILLIVDEVQTGVGRTGYLFAHEIYNIEPDIFTAAKALGNGIPIGALMAKEEVSLFEPGDHASTFGGNFIASEAAIAVLNEIKEKEFLYDVRKKGEYFRNKLEFLKEKYPEEIKDVRGKGLMIGVEIKDTSKIKDICNKMMENGILIGSAGGIALRFVPPLTVTKEEIDECLKVLDKVLGEI